jgi:hypothetical protein
MNLDEIVKHINAISDELYPDSPEVANLCKELITWERENISKVTPRYKEPYKKILEKYAKKILNE